MKFSSLINVYKNFCNKFHSVNRIKLPLPKPRPWKHESRGAATRAATRCRTAPLCCWKHAMEYAPNAAAFSQPPRRRDKIVVIMGATGAGKSRLSVDLATRFQAEIINSDKMQVYRGLDITTNKIPVHERLGIHHHLLGDFESSFGEFTPTQYRSHASSAISQIIARRKLPLVVGGSNSFIYALLSDRFNPESDVFNGSESVCTDLRYRCCFLWLDVSLPVLNEYLMKRVDDMLDSGMLDELAQYYDSDINETEPDVGLRKAIGVAEFERYFRMNPGEAGRPKETRGGEDEQMLKAVYGEAVRAIKDNTCQLAKRQVDKILRLKSGGWDLRRLEATEAFRAALEEESSEGGGRWSDIWARQVVEPSVKIVKRFLADQCD
ncbi:hypothetical protein Nepgr_017047 [Nepenthes gracilis]|uniref:Adenylate isopentenyltransferase n=1 Tax=Nepenthes gracilis TaxID=150966 RepID=A0AAD3SRC5_NEPGR|nr:hypothetical protein Nepgr_017047 [Nepenthes gracilis]